MKMIIFPSAGDLYDSMFLECFYGGKKNPTATKQNKTKQKKNSRKMKYQYLLKVSDFVVNVANWSI